MLKRARLAVLALLMGCGGASFDLGVADEVDSGDGPDTIADGDVASGPDGGDGADSVQLPDVAGDVNETMEAEAAPDVAPEVPEDPEKTRCLTGSPRLAWKGTAGCFDSVGVLGKTFHCVFRNTASSGEEFRCLPKLTGEHWSDAFVYGCTDYLMDSVLWGKGTTTAYEGFVSVPLSSPVTPGGVIWNVHEAFSIATPTLWSKNPACGTYTGKFPFFNAEDRTISAFDYAVSRFAFVWVP